jgi:hypothetical protein
LLLLLMLLLLLLLELLPLLLRQRVHFPSQRNVAQLRQQCLRLCLLPGFCLWCQQLNREQIARHMRFYTYGKA